MRDNPAMIDRAPRGRVVWATGTGRICPTCGWPADRCQCSTSHDETVPMRIEARLRLESKGRGGKSVTVVDGLPRNAEFLEGLLRSLKKALGSGGTIREGSLELQGDRRGALRTLLGARGFSVKG
jgi:translation initiation factor 1